MNAQNPSNSPSDEDTYVIVDEEQNKQSDEEQQFPKAPISTNSSRGDTIKLDEEDQVIPCRVLTTERQHTLSTNQSCETSKSSSTLTPTELALTVITTCFGSMLAMADQTGITMILPYISDNLDAHKSIQWATTGALISSTMFNILVGRFSNIFGTKWMIVISFFMIGVFELCSVFAPNKVVFYIFRSLTGIGNGGIISLSIVIISKSVNLSKRPLYQGILGAAIGIGSCIGPFISVTFVQHKISTHTGWRQYFSFLGLLFILLGITSISTIKDDDDKIEFEKNEKYHHKIDFLGFIFSLTTVVLIVIPLNMGGILWPWKSIQIYLCIGFSIISFLILIYVEHKCEKTALIPLKFFTDFKVCNFMLQTLLISMIYSSMIFYLPFYYSMVQEYNTSQTPVILLAFLIPIAIISVLSASVIKKIDSFKKIIIQGYTLLFIGMLIFVFVATKKATLASSIGSLMIMGIGTGNIFTPLTTGIQSQVDNDDIAVVLSTKGVFKTLGNSLGVAISSVIYSNSLINQLAKHELTPPQTQYILSNLTRKMTLSFMFEGEQLEKLETIYLASLKVIFYCWLPTVLTCLVLSFFIKDKTMKEEDEPVNEKRISNNIYEDNHHDQITEKV